MRLRQLSEAFALGKRLELPSNFDGNLYKAMYLDPARNPWRLRQVPGYCWTHEVDAGLAFSRSTGGKEMPFMAVVKFPMPGGMLDHFPSEVARDQGLDYDRDTDIKPGWLANLKEHAQSGIADVAIVTIPQDLGLVAIHGLGVAGETMAKSSTLMGLEAYSSYDNGRFSDADLWAANKKHMMDILSNYGQVTQEGERLVIPDIDVFFKVYLHHR